ncbi:hypothetical protein JTB14_030807 [Gonioctena quinquepunctata]|nr:hypothetical protein JTB14_030807 [Gonioctena quinquepunctata]
MLREDLSGATSQKEAGMRKKIKEPLLNQFEIGLHEDLMRETGVLLLREEILDLEKADIKHEDLDSVNRKRLLHLWKTRTSSLEMS